MSRFLTQISYTGKNLKPTFRFSDGEEFMPLGKTIGLTFDLSERFCIGWHNMATGESHPCPESSRTEKKFEVCVVCQKRTGFNPAFYHTNKISAQQEARNAEPHRLYLAYMGKDYIKVGISWDKRGNNRLLDQGARAGLILEVFPTAMIARQYEARVARLDGMHETTPTRTKLALLTSPLDEKVAQEQLHTAKQRIEEALLVHFSGNDILLFDKYYTQSSVPSGDITSLTKPLISGNVEALIGDILITRYDGRTLALPLRQFVGYPVELTDKLLPLDLEPQQMQLF